jgi:hypothetical protein
VSFTPVAAPSGLHSNRKPFCFGGLSTVLDINELGQAGGAAPVFREVSDDD